MFRLIRSNRVEILLESLADQFAQHPLSSPFMPEQVLVLTGAMGRWLQGQLAQRQGIAANLQYPLPAKFLWALARDLLPEVPASDPLARERLAWMVYRLLPELADQPGFEEPKHYLQDDPQGLRRWQLAEQIASRLDRYQFYRPEWIRAWDRGEETDWQAQLWRRLTADLPCPHRVALFDALIRRLHEEPAPTPCPERLSLFAISSLPPLFLAVFQALARHTQVDFYLHGPTNEYWADLVSQKTLARKRLQQPEVVESWEVGHPLLSSWGRQGQALQDLLLAREIPMEELDRSEAPSGDRLLERLQRAIYQLHPPPSDPGQRIPVLPDDSIQVHRCHSALRECQVLHDALLEILDENPDLRPEDVLVMVPDIRAYAPAIEAVFRQQEEPAQRPFLPWNLSDITALEEHPLVQVFLRLLTLPESRFTQSEVLSYLDVPELADHFGLSEEGIVQVKQWLAKTQVRWGLDGDHRARFCLPNLLENTWEQAGQRLFAGYALGNLEAFGEIAPIPGILGKDAEVLGHFWQFLHSLQGYGERLAAPRSPADWVKALGQLLDDFFGTADAHCIPILREAVASLASAEDLDQPISLQLVRNWLQDRLRQENPRMRMFSGGVSLCGLQPMRSLPFPVICILGLQEQDFPSRELPVAFDRMAGHWRPGDPHRGFADRYLFLETLLCARRYLYLSYVGRSIRDNQPRQPSILVDELLDYLDSTYRPESGSGKLSERLIREHPLQPFSEKNFLHPQKGNEPRGSYDSYWLEIAKALHPDAHDKAPKSPIYLSQDAAPRQEISLSTLEDFVRHPLRHWIQKRLGIRFPKAEEAEDEESFSLTGLQAYQVKRRLVEGYLQGQIPSQKRLSAEGRLPHGVQAQLEYEVQRQAAAKLFQQLKPYAGQQPKPLHVHLQLDLDGTRWQLRGAIPGYYPAAGLLHWHSGRLRGEDLLVLWIRYLAYHAGGAVPSAARLCTQTERFCLDQDLSPDAARTALAPYLRWYSQGIRQPLFFFPESSFAYAKLLWQGKSLEAAQRAAQGAWDGNPYRGKSGERDKPEIALALRGYSGKPLEKPDFARLAQAFYQTPLSAGCLSAE